MTSARLYTSASALNSTEVDDEDDDDRDDSNADAVVVAAAVNISSIQIFQKSTLLISKRCKRAKV